MLRSVAGREKSVHRSAVTERFRAAAGSGGKRAAEVPICETLLEIGAEHQLVKESGVETVARTYRVHHAHLRRRRGEALCSPNRHRSLRAHFNHDCLYLL